MASESKLKSFVNVLLDRARLAALMGRQFGGARDIYKAAGYEKALSFDHFLARFLRQDIAKKIVCLPVTGTWHQPPKIVSEDEAFNTAFADLAQRLDLWRIFRRADTLCGIGRFAVVVLGLPGNLSEPVGKLDGPSDALFVQPFGENSVSSIRFEADASNPRFGKPTAYGIKASETAFGAPKANIPDLHHSRVLHIADDTLENDLFGSPRLESVFNRLFDLEKICGASAEAFWRVAFKGLQVDLDKDSRITPEAAAALEEDLDNYQHELRRIIRTQGVDINELGSDAVDPRGAFMVTVQLISGATGIPVRFLLGSERGSITATQDERRWTTQMRDRQKNFAGPKIVRVFIERMIEFGVLTDPDGFTVEWPLLTAQTEAEQADTANIISRAALNIARQSQLGVEVIGRDEFREKFLGLTP